MFGTFIPMTILADFHGPRNVLSYQATEIAKAEGLLKKDKKADRGKSKEELKEEEEAVIRYVVPS
jgi:hypothetical protein